MKAALALLAVIALPGAAPAQYRLPTLVSSVKADSLHDAAISLAAAGRLRDAASLHRRSAELRSPEDPAGFRCLNEAGALAYFARNPTQARNDMAKAAGHALARGDLRTAAHAYLDAAWIAQEQRKPKEVWELGRRAELLADSPLLGVADRGAILKRIKRVPETTQMAIRP